MFSRYNKVVPPHQKDLIRQHGLPRPNWYVGAAEQSSSPVDPQLRQEIDQIKNDLSGQQAPGQSSGSDDSSETQSSRDKEPAGKASNHPA